MKKIYLIIFPALICLLNGCASIVTGTHQQVAISTPPVHGANCILSNNKGTWYAKNTPTTVKVHKAFEGLHVTCHRAGCLPATRTIGSNTRAMVFGNAIVGGVIGAGIDSADGAAYSYPSKIVIPMQCRHHK